MSKAATPSHVERPTKDKPLGEVQGPLARWRTSPALDFFAIAILGGVLITIGLVMVLSSSSVANIADGRSPFADFFSQAVYAVIGLLLLVVTAKFPLRVFRAVPVATALLVLGLLLQSLVLTPLGWGSGGNRNWIKVGPISGQPSEFLKLALAVWLGAFLAANRNRLREKPVLGTAVAGVGAAVGLILAGRDLGTTMMVVFLAGGALWVAGVPKRYFLMGGAVGIVGVLVLVFTSPNRLNRAATWLSGDCENSDACFQSLNGLRALAEGGIIGAGIGQGKQKWGRLPEANNDFIFAVIGEELGLVGTLLVVALFAMLGLVLFRMVTRHSGDPFVQITTAAITSWILTQAFVNMSVVTGLLPVLGVPLPFVSAGGSALIASMLALGLLLNFAANEPGAKDAIRASSIFAKESATVQPRSSRPRKWAAPAAKKAASTRKRSR